jgi:hypothetical protein
MSGPKINAAAMRRHRAEVLQRRAASPDPLPAEFLTWLQTIYQPEGPLRAHWPQLLSFVVAALTASRIRGEASLHKYVTHLTYFGGWLLLQGVSLELSSGLVRAQVDEYCRVGMPGNTQKSRSDRRSRLRGIADQVNPDQAPTPTKSIPRPAIKAPHSASEMANICRCAGLQPTVELTRQMCLCVSVGAGAGIDSSELKLLLGSHVVDLDDQGIRIDIPGDRTRSVWVLREYEDLLRRGLVGRSPLRPLLARAQAGPPQRRRRRLLPRQALWRPTGSGAVPAAHHLAGDPAQPTRPPGCDLHGGRFAEHPHPVRSAALPARAHIRAAGSGPSAGRRPPMSQTVEATITALEHALWVIDHALIIDRPSVDERGKPDPHHRPAPPRSIIDVLEEAIRPTKRGVTRRGLTVRLWLALLIVAARSGRATIAHMHEIATGNLPRQMQWQLGILTQDPANGGARQLTAKQLYGMAEKITEHLDIDPQRHLGAPEEARRRAIVTSVQDALIEATHILPHTWSSYAVDESGVWSWPKGKRKPADLPDVDPTDEDAKHDASTPNHTDRPDCDDVEQQLPDEDTTFGVSEDPTGNPAPTGTTDDAAATTNRLRKAPITCWLARWGVKTHKNGKRSSYFGYALHVLLRVPDVIKGAGKGARTDSLQEPLLIEQVQLSSASTDIVNITLGMVKAVLARGHKVIDLLGDRHYSYKQYDRWVSKLWAMGVRQVLDLRKHNHGATDYNGAQIIAGTPHCGVPEHLIRLERPPLGATPDQIETFTRQVQERQKYAMARIQTAWQNGDGKTRWRCAAKNGTVGCPRVAGSVETALASNLPIVIPPQTELPWCKDDTATLGAGPHMKYQQQEYWGLGDWLISWNRRTYVEGCFGNIKNHHTGNVHRGFTCFTGMPLITLTMTAAAVSYNLRELDTWHDRASEGSPDNPLLAIYAAHPLYQRTRWQHGFTMLTSDQATALDQQWMTNAATDGEGKDDLTPAA